MSGRATRKRARLKGNPGQKQGQKREMLPPRCARPGPGFLIRRAHKKSQVCPDGQNALRDASGLKLLPIGLALASRPEADPACDGGLGFRVIRRLVAEPGVEMGVSPEPGLCFRLSLPVCVMAGGKLS
jgi:hypothetical protein